MEILALPAWKGALYMKTASRRILIFAVVVSFGCSRHKALTYDEPLLPPPPPARKESSNVHAISERFLLFSSAYNKPSTSTTNTTSTVLVPSLGLIATELQRHADKVVSRRQPCVCQRGCFFPIALKQCGSDKDPCFPAGGKSDKYIVPCIFIRSQRSRICAALQADGRCFYSSYATKHTSLPHTSTGLSRSKVAVPQTCPICFLSSRTNVSNLPRG